MSSLRDRENIKNLLAHKLQTGGNKIRTYFKNQLFLYIKAHRLVSCFPRIPFALSLFDYNRYRYLIAIVCTIELRKR